MNVRLCNGDKCLRTPVKAAVSQGGSKPQFCVLAVLNMFKGISFPIQRVEVEKKF